MTYLAIPKFSRREEARHLLGVALPLMAAYMAEYLMFLTTKLVVGKLGFQHLAAVGLSGSLAFEIIVVFMGLLSITGVLAAQAEGAGLKEDAGQAARQGLILATIIAVPLTAAVFNLDTVFRWTGQDPVVTELATPYIQVISLFVAPALWFTVLRDFIAALARTRAIMFITLAAVGINWGVAEGLVHGRWGLPELGVAGAGVATVAVHWLMVVALLAYIYRTPALRGYGLFRARLRVIWPIIREIVWLGTPIAGLVAVEAGLFTAVGLLSGAIGAEALAAHQVLMGWIGIPFMIALAVAEGAMVRTAFNMGRQDPAGARQAGLLGVALGGGSLLLLVAAPLLLAAEITNLFISRDDEGFEQVAAIVVNLMIIASIFQVADGVQVIAARSLRAVKDAFLPLWIGAFCYWVIGIGGGWIMAFPMGWGQAGLWSGLAVGIICAGSLLTWRFVWLTGKIIRGRQQAAS
ncbi:MAG: MATE family efflux transporter [Pikeienuella sp.]